MIPFILITTGAFLIGTASRNNKVSGNKRNMGVTKLNFAKGGPIKDIDGYVAYFNVFRNGSLTPVILEFFENEDDAKKFAKEKSVKVKELYKMPINSEVRISDKKNFTLVKNYLHSEEKVMKFFENKDSFYKKNHAWVTPIGYEWDNWNLKKI